MARSVTLGIPGLELSAGDHVCVFYRGSERDEILVPFLEEGLRAGDKCICVVDTTRPDALLAGCAKRDQLEIFSSDSTYLAGGEFRPSRMIEFWEESVRSALGHEGYSFVRVVGEMTWGLRQAPGVEQLVGYESQLNRYLPRYPQVILCLYDIERFSGELLLDMLATHPKVLLGGLVLDNPYYLEPDEFLASRK